ncbi:MAG: hypothetical protein V4682_02680 [Patescibacteria group bacterium]
MNYMRILSPKKMAEDLRADKVGKREFYVYSGVFVIAIVCGVLMMVGIWDLDIAYRPEYLEASDEVLAILASLGSLLLAYHVNKKGDGKRFWYRYLSLGFPIGVVLGAVGFAVFILATMFGIVSIEYSGYADSVILAVLYGLSIFMTWKYMKMVASGG